MRFLGPLIRRIAIATVFAAKIVTANSWPETTTNQAVSPDQLDHAIASAADYLDRACSPDGMFVYRVDAVSGKKKLLV
jgi:hypothetical protein